MEKPQYYIIQPSIKTFGGIKVEKDTEFETYNDDQTVHQTLKNLVLTTEITKDLEINGIKSKEESKMTTTLPEGIVLLWSEETGYIVPNYTMVRPEEGIKILEQINSITGEIENSNKEE